MTQTKIQTQTLNAPAATATATTTPPPERVVIACADGVSLQGHFLRTAHEAPGLPVLLCPATGVRQHFYLKFAQWLTGQGHDVLVFDYRGIGLSLQGPLKHSSVTLLQWGVQDQVAALDWLLQRTGAAQALLVGHSAGGQMMGLLPNQHRIARVVGVAVSTGWFRGMRLGYRLPARAVLCGLMPLLARIKGYAPTSMVGLGEDLPTQVALQWGRWCSAGGYALNAVKHHGAADFHAQVRMPITIVHASDDDIATPATVADLVRTFPAAPTQVKRIEPKAHGLKTLGHIDWFRSSHQAVWPLIAAGLRADA